MKHKKLILTLGSLLSVLLFAAPSPTPCPTPSQDYHEQPNKHKDVVDCARTTQRLLQTLNSDHEDRSKCNPPPSSHVIQIEEFTGPEAYRKFSNLVNQINALIEKAKEDSSNLALGATAAFRSKDYDRAKELSKLEIEYYPIVSFRGVKCRVFGKFEMRPERGWSPSLGNPFSSLISLRIENDNIYLYKGIPKKHLCAIQKSGLDSKFGGVDGASENTSGFEQLTAEYDRGKMFFCNKFGGLCLGGFQKKGIELSQLKIRVPIQEALSLNLTNDIDGWFIAGTAIPPADIFVYDDKIKAFQPIASIDCNSVPLFSSIVEKRALKTVYFSSRTGRFSRVSNEDKIFPNGKIYLHLH